MAKPTQLDSIMAENMERRKALRKKGIIVLNEEFNDETAESLIYQLQEMEEDKLIEEVRIDINSHGGSVWAMFGIVDVIDSMKKPVNTRCIGKAYSAGAFLLMSGTGTREAYKRSDILIHDVATEFGYNKNAQIQIDAACIARINKMIEAHIRKHTKMKQKDIDLYLNSNVDVFVNPQQALKQGIIDKIL